MRGDDRRGGGTYHVLLLGCGELELVVLLLELGLEPLGLGVEECLALGGLLLLAARTGGEQLLGALALLGQVVVERAEPALQFLFLELLSRTHALQLIAQPAQFLLRHCRTSSAGTSHRH
jgi:hypothetical protein